MYLDKATYERAGLVGKPYGAKGARGLKPRWVVEFDLRSPSMFRGKKGFDRLVYACKEAFSEPVTWLFCNVALKGEFSILPPVVPTSHRSPIDILDQCRARILLRPSTQPDVQCRPKHSKASMLPCRPSSLLLSCFPEQTTNICQTR